MDVFVHGELLSRNHSTEHHHVRIRHHMFVAWCDQRRVLEVLPQRRMAQAKNSKMMFIYVYQLLPNGKLPTGGHWRAQGMWNRLADTASPRLSLSLSLSLSQVLRLQCHMKAQYL